ncbi:hypothetical protein [Sphingomonas sp. PR090111-T3T-6A]|uniref:hypothetical protein n=1 Tax=Sphingomonas sp. PR090111-T3T-6A TaxID=685778 RepID=UPI00037347D4|nr:hypothetical protein [Sphingomonas sp. PR090111-T3T-6A]
MLKGFAQSVVTGALAAAVVPIVFLAILTIGQPMSASDFRTVTTILFCILAVSFGTVLSSALTLGLATTYLLRAIGRENLPAYMCAGAAGGAAIPLIVGYLIGGKLGAFSLLGIFGGALTGRAWWLSYRRYIAEDC